MRAVLECYAAEVQGVHLECIVAYVVPVYVQVGKVLNYTGLELVRHHTGAFQLPKPLQQYISSFSSLNSTIRSLIISGFTLSQSCYGLEFWPPLLRKCLEERSDEKAFLPREALAG